MKYAWFSVGLPESTPEQVVKQLRENGYHGVEWRVTTDKGDTTKPGFWGGNRTTLQESWSDEEFKAIAKMTKDNGLEVPNLGSYAKAFEIDKVKRNMEIANIFNAPNLRVNVYGYDGKQNYNELFKKDQENFAKVIELGKAYKVKPLIELHMNSIVASASAAIRFLAPFKPEEVGVIHDAGNLVFEGFENYQAGLEMLGAYLAHVHIKNYGFVSENIEGPQKLLWKAVPSPLRKGAVNFKTLFAVLKGAGYDGWLSLEDFSKEATQEEKIKDNLIFLKEMEAL